MFNLAAPLSLLLCAATVVLWVRSYWSVQCLGYAAPSRGEVDVLMKEGRLAVVWGPPAELFLGTRSIAPGTLTEANEFHLVPVRSGVVRGVGPWFVQELCTSGGGGGAGGGWRSLPPGVMPKFLNAPSVISGYPDTVRRWEAMGISYQVRLIVSILPDHYPDMTGTICCREMWFPQW